MVENHKVEWGYKQQVSRVPRGIHVNRNGQNVCSTLKQPRIDWKWRSKTSLRNNPEECSSHLLRGGSLKLHPLRKIHQVYFRRSLRYHICKFGTFHTGHVRTSSTYIPNTTSLALILQQRRYSSRKLKYGFRAVALLHIRRQIAQGFRRVPAAWY